MSLTLRPTFFPFERWVLLAEYVAFASVLFGIKLWVIHTYGNATPFWDQWDAEAAFLYKPVLEGTHKWGDWFSPHNQHRIFTTRLLALALLSLNGIWNPLFQMVVNAALHVSVLVLAIVFLTRVIGRRYLSTMLVFSAVLFGVPYAWENTLAGFQSQFYFVILFSISGLWLTTTKEPFSLGWWSGLLCAILAFFSLASGVFVLAASAATGILIYALNIRRTWQQLAAISLIIGLFLLGVWLTPHIPGHERLKAASFRQFLDAMAAALSWPLPPSWLLAIVRNLPEILFVLYIIRQRPLATNYRWFLLSLVLWGFGQGLSIAYGRAVGPVSSRYLDLFAVAVLTNLACLIWLMERGRTGFRRLSLAAGCCWVLVVVMVFGFYATRHLAVQLASKRGDSLMQETNVRNYLRTYDITHLKDKPFFHIPYPKAERLASILASPTIRSILPSAIRAPLKTMSIKGVDNKAFGADGLDPSMAKPNRAALGSYGPLAEKDIGEAIVTYDAGRQGNYVSIPVAGYPLKKGMKIEIEQHGRRRTASISSDPKESWGMAYAKVDSGLFDIHLIDSSSSHWLAVGEPAIAGKWDEIIGRLLSSGHVFVMFGLAILLGRIMIADFFGYATDRSESQKAF